MYNPIRVIYMLLIYELLTYLFHTGCPTKKQTQNNNNLKKSSEGGSVKQKKEEFFFQCSNPDMALSSMK